MDRNVRRIERFSKRGRSDLSRVSQSFDALGGAAKRLVGVFAGLATVGFAKSVIADLDGIGKTADRLGLGVEALQELRIVAESAGISQNTLDMAMQRFGRRVAEAREGTGEAVKALKEMGVALRDSSGAARPLEAVLDDVADAMRAVPEQTDRNRLAMKLFDSEGVALVNLLREGSAGMAAMRQEARDLGAVIDESLVRGAEDAQTKLDLMSRVISANLSSALINVAPLLVDAAAGVAALARAAGEFFAVDWAAAAAGVPGASMADLLADFEGLESELSAVTKAQAAYNASVAEFGADSAQAAGWARDLATAQTALNAARTARDEADNATANFKESLELTRAEIEAAREKAKLNALSAEDAERARIASEAEARLVQLTNDMRAATSDGLVSDEDAENLRVIVQMWERSQIAASKILNGGKASGGGGSAKAATDAEKYAAALAEIARLSGDASLATADFGRVMAAVDALYQSGAISAQKYSEITGVIERQNSALASTAGRLEGEFEGLFTSIISGANSASDAIGNLLVSLGNMALNAAFSGLFGGVSASLAPIFTPARANGGPALAGVPHLVNEKTANSEIFVPSRSGAVLNVGQAKDALAGYVAPRASAVSGAPVVHFAPVIDARGADQAAVDRLDAQLRVMQSNMGRIVASATRQNNMRGVR